jgi:hypothetical protein
MKLPFKYAIQITLILLSATACINYTKAQLPDGYKGAPYRDSVYTGNKLNPAGAQMIPGRIELACYDLGGEGVAYHDNNPKNEGALSNMKKGHLRPGISEYIASFRKDEGVDIDYTRDIVDFNHPNKVDPKVNQLYIGWQEDGEWTNYTVYVNKAGKYIIYTVYSSIENNPAKLLVNNKFACKLTYPERTGNLHSWTQSEIGTITFPGKGLYLLTVKYSKGLNYGYLDFLYNDARQK